MSAFDLQPNKCLINFLWHHKAQTYGGVQVFHNSITQRVYGRKKDLEEIFALYVSNEFSVFIKAVYTLYLCVWSLMQNYFHSPQETRERNTIFPPPVE